MTTFVSWRYLLIALLAIGLGACGGAAMMKADQEPTIASDIASKRNQYWPQWNNKPAHDRASQTLNPDDGRL